MRIKFSKVIKSMIEEAGGSIDKIDLVKYIELISASFIYNPANYWFGITIYKNPLDLMILQEIMFEKRPDTIIECGTCYGGSAYFMATMMDLMRIDGKIITIDNTNHPVPPYPKKDFVNVDRKKVSVEMDIYQARTHPKIKYLFSDCLKADLPKLGKKVMVVLDCDHSASHVTRELEKYSPLVTLGQYIIVEDTNFFPNNNDGPAVAVKKFLVKNKNFISDKPREKFGVSSNPGGYLLRTS